MLDGDSPTSAERASKRYPTHPGIAYFHDPDRFVGASVATQIASPGHTAWDFYVIYAAGQEWKEEARSLAPSAWFHQLADDPWAGPAHFRRGEDLGPALQEALVRTLGLQAE
jgi:hypothetical protein